MSKDDKLVEALINVTEKNKVEWHWEDGVFGAYFREGYSSPKVLVHVVDNESTFFLVKYGTSLEKIDLLLFDKRKNIDEPALEIEEEDIEIPHRLWTLYKLAERNASGADRIIDDIIAKYSDSSF